MANTDNEIETADFFEDHERKKIVKANVIEDKYEEENSKTYYDSYAYISEPILANDGTIPKNILQFHYSFAYNCQKRFNLCVADQDTIIFASGNIIHFFDITSKKIWFRRCSTGGGIGHITKNPKFDHFAIGENGVNPPIIIYKWPNMEIITLLLDGTTKSYSHLAYSQDGLLLVSQGEDPDYSITLWNWQKSIILLRCKSYSQDVYNVMFSSFVPDHLISCGSGHINFWRMAETFTGLKLKNELGRFGRTEISDIIGIYQMPDKKVVSGCEWGNILLWEEGLIKFEISRKNKQPCHTKPIVQFEYINDELFSVGMDGWILVWCYETIDHANPARENPFLELQPIYEFHISENVQNNSTISTMLMCIQKQKINDPNSTLWFAQDGNGGIWSVDLDTSTSLQSMHKIFTCHAGPIVDMDNIEWGPFVATLGVDGCVHIYNYEKRNLILIHHFHDVGSQIIWLPLKVDATGSTIVCAFGSGIIRIITAAVLTANESNDITKNYTKLIQVLKPHSETITVMTTNSSCSLLVTGSKDKTIFVFHIHVTKTYPTILPIGYIKMPTGITCMQWKPAHETTLLIGCLEGHIAEVALPNLPQSYTSISYELTKCKVFTFKFHSVKSAIKRRQIELEYEKKKLKKIERKRAEMEELKINNPGIEIDEELFLMDSQEELPLPEIYIPEIPNKVLFVQYTNYDTIWLSIAGFDAGYIYEYPCPKSSKIIELKPINSMLVCDARDAEIQSCLSYKKGKYLIFGMQHGEIRVNRIDAENYTDFSNYWILPIHDHYNGYISKMLFSFDKKMFLTCGHDGNLFSFTINSELLDEVINIPHPKHPLPLPNDDVRDIKEWDHPTLEDVIVKNEQDRIKTAAEQKKAKTLEEIQKLTEEYNKIMHRNRYLLPSQQISQHDRELDPRITKKLNEEIQSQTNIMYEKLAFKVEKSDIALKKLMDHFMKPITCVPFGVCKISNPDAVVYSLREKKLDIAFENIYAQVINYIIKSEETIRLIDKEIKKEEDEKEHELRTTESFLKSLNLSAIQDQLGIQIIQMIRKYKDRKIRLEERQKEWDQMSIKKLSSNFNYSDDEEAIENARKNIGEYILKDSSSWNLTKKGHDTMLTKYKYLLQCQKTRHYMREDFNLSLKAIRAKKQNLCKEVLQLIEKLKQIHTEIPEKNIKSLPNVPVINDNIEFPENNLKIKKPSLIMEDTEEISKQHPLTLKRAIDEEYEVLILSNKIHLDENKGTLSTFASSEIKIRTSSMLYNTLENLYVSDNIETIWEREMREARTIRKIYEQDCILHYIDNSYKDLDKQLDKLEKERLDIVVESIYMDLFLLTLNQEFLILRDYEAKESILRKNVNDKLMEQSAAKQKIQTTNIKIDHRNKEISKLQETIKNITSEYMNSIYENKFYDFLRKIFKKKYKLPKEDDESTSTTSSTETTSEEDDTRSIDSKEIGTLYFDENVCPTGCDKDLYNMAFIMRERRYKYESLIKEEHKIIETLRREIESDTKGLKIIDDILKYNANQLESFMLEKQKKLNDIDVTVVLKFHQLQNITKSETVLNVQDSVVFDKTKLSELHARIGELEQETFNLHAKQRKSKIHLHRMKIDCKHMNAELKSLKNEIKEEMMKKFGQEISITNLYETVLQRMIYNIKANLTDLTKSFEEQLKNIKEEYSKELVTLESLIQCNTEKLSFLTVLEEERASLQKILQASTCKEDMLQMESQYNADLIKLQNILINQKQQKELFITDIKNLSMKSRILPPIYPKKSEHEKNIKKNTSTDITEYALDVKNNF